MGTDIHFYAETRPTETSDWSSVDQRKLDEFMGILAVPFGKSFYSSRNYDLFAILADVRNGTGFAGVPTSSGFNPISPPRGLPAKLDPRIQEQADSFASDGHSHSWFTLDEILAFDWTQTVTKFGVVSLVEYAEWKRWRASAGLGPEEYSAHVAGSSVRHITQPEANDLVDNGEAELPKYEFTYIKISWQSTYSMLCREFWYSTIPRLLALGRPENTRIVFWFDN